MNRNDSARPRAISAAPRGRIRSRCDTVQRLRPYVSTAIVVLLLASCLVTLLVGCWNAGAYAATPAPSAPTVGVTSLQQVIDNIRVWLFGLLVAVATLFLTIGGVRLMWANGDPGEAEKGKAALRSAAIGYGLALLAPLIVTIVGSWVA